MSQELGNINIEISLPKKKGTDFLTKAAEAKRNELAGKETMEEAWERVFSMKNSATLQKRLEEAKEAWEKGIIGRNPDKVGKRFSKAEAESMWAELNTIRIKEIRKEMTENTPENYELVLTKERLSEVVSELLKEELIVFDIESTGVDVFKDKIVGHVLSATSTDMHYYIPTGHKDSRPQLEEEYVSNTLRAVYENEQIKKVAHNAKFDYQMLRMEGITVENIYWDTQEAMKILNENEESFGLKNLVTKYLKLESLGYAELFGKGTGFDEVELDLALAYAAKDGDITYKLYLFQKEHLARVGNSLDYFLNVEMPLLRVVSDMELNGYDIDLEYAEEYGKKLDERIAILKERLVEELGDINLNSPAKVKKAIEEHVGHEIKNTDAKETLKPLSKKHPLIKDLLEYKDLFKLNSTYIKAIPNRIEEATGKLHTDLNQNGARTGRFSSSGGTNLQNQSKEARGMFVAPPGYILLGGDWSQQEYRGLTYFSQDPLLMDNYIEGRDLYSEVASEVFKKPIEECRGDSIYRDHAKVLMLAIAYGGGAGMLSNSIGVPKQQAQKFLDEFMRKYKHVEKWVKSNQEFVKRNGFVWIGDKERKRRLPAAKDRKAKGHYSAVFTQSTNARVQGTAAIQTKKTMIALDELCRRKTAEGKGKWSLWVVVHDEAILLVPETITEEDIRDFEDVMLNTHVFGNIPNKCDIELQRRWGDSVELDDFLAGEPIPEL